MSQNKTAYILKLAMMVMVASATLLHSYKANAGMSMAIHSYPTDACNTNCDSEESINNNLIQNYNYVSTNRTVSNTSALNEIATADTIVVGNVEKTFNKMADRSVKYFWENSEIKKSSIGRGVEKAQKSLQKEVAIKTGKTEQKLNFAIDAFQSKARIQYSGYTNAEVSYETRDASVGLHMFEKISENTNLVLGQTFKSNDQMSQVMVNWNW